MFAAPLGRSEDPQLACNRRARGYSDGAVGLFVLSARRTCFDVVKSGAVGTATTQRQGHRIVHVNRACRLVETVQQAAPSHNIPHL